MTIQRNPITTERAARQKAETRVLALEAACRRVLSTKPEPVSQDEFDDALVALKELLEKPKKEEEKKR